MVRQLFEKLSHRLLMVKIARDSWEKNARKRLQDIQSWTFAIILSTLAKKRLSWSLDFSIAFSLTFSFCFLLFQAP